MHDPAAPRDQRQRRALRHQANVRGRRASPARPTRCATASPAPWRSSTRAPAAPQARRPPHARRAQEGAQEVRAARRPCALPVLQALAIPPRRPSSAPQRATLRASSSCASSPGTRAWSLVAVTRSSARGTPGGRALPGVSRGLVDLAFEAADPAALAGRADARLHLPAPRRLGARRCAALRKAGIAVRGPLGRLPAARSRPPTGAAYGEHGAPELFGQAVYGLPELHREDPARRRARGGAGLLPDLGAAAPDAVPARGAGASRRPRGRREVGRVGSRSQARGRLPVRRGRGQRLRLQGGRQPPPRARDRAGGGPRRRRRGAHRASRPHAACR